MHLQLLSSLKPPVLVEKRNTLPSQKRAEDRNPQAICPISPKVTISPSSSEMVTTAKEMRWSNKNLSTSFSAISFAACLATSCFIDRYAFVASRSRKTDVTPRICCDPLTSLLHKDCSLSSSSVQTSSGVGLPGCVCIDQIWFFVPFSGLFCPTSHCPTIRQSQSSTLSASPENRHHAHANPARSAVLTQLASFTHSKSPTPSLKASALLNPAVKEQASHGPEGFAAPDPSPLHTCTTIRSGIEKAANQCDQSQTWRKVAVHPLAEHTPGSSNTGEFP